MRAKQAALLASAAATLAIEKRAAIYTRYSTDRQDGRSIDDQIKLGRENADRLGLRVVRVFKDYAKSGSTLDRDGIRELRQSMLAGEFDVLIIESLTRLSREPEDLHGLFRRLEFRDIEVVTNEGKVTPMHVMLMGWFGKEYLNQIAEHVSRHHKGFAAEGKIPGSIPEGYKFVEGQKGVPEIDRERADLIVLRAFKEYIAGKSPSQIARGMNQDGLRTKLGYPFTSQTFLGGGVSRLGMLQNPIYIGKPIWRRSRQVRDPDTDTKLKRAPKEGEKIMTIDAPLLRIVPPDLWDAAQAVREKRRRGVPGKVVARRDHLLSGLLRCGACNGPMRIRTNAKGGIALFACAASGDSGQCKHSKTYNSAKLIEGIRQRMIAYTTDPEVMANAEAELKLQHAAARKNAERDTAAEARKKLNKAQAAIDRIVGLLLRGVVTEEEASGELVKLRTEKASQEERLRLAEADRNVIAFHPNAWQQAFKRLRDVMSLNPTDPQFVATFRKLIDCIVVHPTAIRMPYEITPYANPIALMGAEPKAFSAAEVLQEEGISRDCIDARRSSAACTKTNKAVPLGRWRLAA